MQSPIHPRIDRPDRLEKLHLPHLDSLRGIAALLVVLHHAHYEATPTGTLGLLTAWMREGHFLVTFFIILSGYCLTLPTLATGGLREGVGNYLKRRAWRLLPAYYAAMVGSLFLIATVMGQPTGRHWDFALPVTTGSILTHVFLIHNFELAHLYKINHVFWSIAVEWQIYFAFPILLRIARKVGPWWSTALALTLGTIGSQGLVGTTHFGLTPHYHGMFALGMLAATVAHHPRWEYAATEVSWWTLAALSTLAACGVYKTQTYETIDLPVGVAFASCLIALARPGRVPSWLNSRCLVSLGGFSYSLYLVHAPLQHAIVEQIFWRVGLPASLEFPLLLGLGTPLILAFAYGFHRVFEKPFLPDRRSSGIPAPMGLALEAEKSGREPAPALERRSESV